MNCPYILEYLLFTHLQGRSRRFQKIKSLGRIVNSLCLLLHSLTHTVQTGENENLISLKCLNIISAQIIGQLLIYRKRSEDESINRKWKLWGKKLSGHVKLKCTITLKFTDFIQQIWNDRQRMLYFNSHRDQPPYSVKKHKGLSTGGRDCWEPAILKVNGWVHFRILSPVSMIYFCFHYYHCVLISVGLYEILKLGSILINPSKCFFFFNKILNILCPLNLHVNLQLAW